MVFIPYPTSNFSLLLLTVCLCAVVSSKLLRPTLPSLKTELKNTVGYAVASEPSSFKGIVP